MPDIKIDVATQDSDVEAVKQLCRDFVSWQLEEFPERREIILAYFEPTKYEKTLADLPKIHSRPKGAMLLARIDGQPMGCIMYHEMEHGIAEVKRLFVSKRAHGMGLGELLVSQMLERVADDEYQAVRLDTARFLTAAIRLYTKMGFQEQEPFTEVPPEVKKIAVFMEKKL